jgi:restriction endonuclease-like protein
VVSGGPKVGTTSYRNAQLHAQLAFLRDSDSFSPAAKIANGIYRGIPRDFVLPGANAIENLFPPIRERVASYFKRREIRWHQANAHLLSSQVCCLNFLEPFSHEPEALRTLLQSALGPIDKMLPLEPGTDPDRFVAFEFIGGDYLNESSKNGRTRGANCTSVDAAVRYQRPGGSVEIALIEWKYTENYGRPEPSPRNEERQRRYERIAFTPDGPLRNDLGMNLRVFFTEPIYQLFRQQMLAFQMEKAREVGATVVLTMLVAPRANEALDKLRIDAFSRFGKTVSTVWPKLLRDPNHFTFGPLEDLFKASDVAISKSGHLTDWRSYVEQRYGFG